MPFKSQAQAGYLHSHPEILGKAGLKEWDAATAGKHLPEHVKKYDQGGKVEVKKETKMASIYDGLKDKATGHKKTIKSMTHTKTHNGKHVITHKHHAPHDGMEHDETHMMNDMGDVHQHMEERAGTPNEGEAAPDASTPQLTASPAPAPAAAAGAMPAGM
jgi:hypothetical protein